MGGCASSSSSPADAQAMLEKQREIMLQRQREFEQRRAGQSNNANQNTEIKGKQPSPALGAKPAQPPKGEQRLDASSTGTISRENSKGDVNAGANQVPTPRSKDVHDMAMYGRDVMTKRADYVPRAKPKELSPAATTTEVASNASPEAKTPTAEESGATIEAKASKSPVDSGSRATANSEDNTASSEAKASKFTLDAHDLNARRSKNVHDLAMYGKDVTRRASFNPRPKESPFTPEMQAMMRAGHEAMMAVELEKKQQRIIAGEANATQLPIAEFEDEEAAKEKEKNNEKEKEENGRAEPSAEAPSVSKGTTKLEEISKEPMNDLLEGDEAMDTATSSKPASEPAGDEANSKYVARDPHDRLSRNIHDYGQYMGQAKAFRRASYIPPPLPGT